MPVDFLPRPRPLLAAAAEVQFLHAPAAGLVTALASAAVITATSGSLFAALWGLLPGALATASAVIGARHVAAVANEVTPLAAPMTEDPVTGELVRLAPVGYLPGSK